MVYRYSKFFKCRISTDEMMGMRDNDNVTIPGWFLDLTRARRFDTVDMLVMSHVWSHWKRYNEWFSETNENLAKNCGVTVLTLKKHIKRLIDVGFLNRDVYHQPHVHRVLSIHMPGLRDAMEMVQTEVVW